MECYVEVCVNVKPGLGKQKSLLGKAKNFAVCTAKWAKENGFLKAPANSKKVCFLLKQNSKKNNIKNERIFFAFLSRR